MLINIYGPSGVGKTSLGDLLYKTIELNGINVGLFDDIKSINEVQNKESFDYVIMISEQKIEGCDKYYHITNN